MIRYPIRTDYDDDALGPCVLAGPSCDSVDVLYEKEPYLLPVTLEIGAKVLIEGDGRLYDDLFLGRLQRLSAAEVLCDLRRDGPPAGGGRRSDSDPETGNCRRAAPPGPGRASRLAAARLSAL